MSAPSAIEFLVEFPITSGDLASLSEERRTMYALLSFAINELNTLGRLSGFAAHPPCGQENIDIVSAIQSATVLRVWSAKLFELFDALESCEKQVAADAGLLEFIVEFKNRFSQQRQSEGYSVARNIRHESTNHYKFDAIRKNLNFIDESANCKLQFHSLLGNSFYPYGEEIAFVGRINRHFSSSKDSLKGPEQIQLWMAWNLEVTKLANEVFQRFLKKFIIGAFPKRRGSRKTYWIPPSLVAEIGSVKVPVFIRKSEL